MNNEPFVIERTYNAPVERVWQAITSKEQMKQWYFDIAEFEPTVGFEFSFIGSKDCKEYVHLCKITEVVPQKKLAYSWTYRDFEGYSVVTFELFAEGNTTRLKLTHEGLESFGNVADFAREDFAGGWGALIGTNLQKFVEEQV